MGGSVKVPTKLNLSDDGLEKALSVSKKQDYQQYASVFRDKLFSVGWVSGDVTMVQLAKLIGAHKSSAKRWVESAGLEWSKIRDDSGRLCNGLSFSDALLFVSTVCPGVFRRKQSTRSTTRARVEPLAPNFSVLAADFCRVAELVGQEEAYRDALIALAQTALSLVKFS